MAGVLAAAAWTATAPGPGPGMRKGDAGRDGRRPLERGLQVTARSGRSGRDAVPAVAVAAFGSGVVASRRGAVAGAGGVFQSAAGVAGVGFGRSVAGVGNAVGDGAFNDGQLVADTGQERQVPAGVRAGAGTVAVRPPGAAAGVRAGHRRAGLPAVRRQALRRKGHASPAGPRGQDVFPAGTRTAPAKPAPASARDTGKDL
jgi:hypothetical protein